MAADEGNKERIETPWENGAGGVREDSRLILDLEGFEGPLDVLLSLARDQKVDLVHISILALADQYLDFIARACRGRLELAAEYLVMAAWLAYLKSRLLLPQAEGDEEPGGPELAAALAFHLQRYNAMREAGARLMERPQLDRDFFPRGAPEGIRNIHRSVYEVTLYDVLKAYGEQQRHRADPTLRIAPTELYAADDVLDRLNRLLGTSRGWQTFASFLPENLTGDLVRRSAIAATLAASLELAKQGRVEIRQSRVFGPIFLRRSSSAPTEGAGAGDESFAAETQE